MGRGQQGHHPQRPPTSITASPKLWALLVHCPPRQGHQQHPRPCAVVPRPQVLLQPAPLPGSRSSGCATLKTTACHLLEVLSPTYGIGQGAAQHHAAPRHQFKPGLNPRSTLSAGERAGAGALERLSRCWMEVLGPGTASNSCHLYWKETQPPRTAAAGRSSTGASRHQPRTGSSTPSPPAPPSCSGTQSG